MLRSRRCAKKASNCISGSCGRWRSGLSSSSARLLASAWTYSSCPKGTPIATKRRTRAHRVACLAMSRRGNDAGRRLGPRRQRLAEVGGDTCLPFHKGCDAVETLTRPASSACVQGIVLAEGVECGRAAAHCGRDHRRPTTRVWTCARTRGARRA